MISLMIDLALFLLVLFLLVPGFMISLMILRDSSFQRRKQAGWHKEEAGKVAG